MAKAARRTSAKAKARKKTTRAKPAAKARGKRKTAARPAARKKKTARKPARTAPAKRKRAAGSSAKTRAKGRAKSARTTLSSLLHSFEDLVKDTQDLRAKLEPRGTPEVP